MSIEAAYLFALGKLLADDSSYREAQRVFERSIELDGSDAYAYLELARLHQNSAQIARSAERRRQNLVKAAENIERARELDAENVDVLRTFAQVFMRLGEHQIDALNRAQEAFELLRGKTDGDLVSLTSLAQIYLWKREPAKAAEVLEEASSYLPGHRMIQTMLVDALLGSGQLEKGETALSRLVEIDGGSLDNFVRLAELRSQLKDHRGAAEALSQVADDIADDSRLRLLYARELHLSGQNDVAFTIVDALVTDDPADEGRRRLRISILSSLARYREATRELELVVADAAGTETRAEDAVMLARLLERTGRVDDAVTQLRRSVEAAENDERSLSLKLALVDVMDRNGRSEEAEVLLREELASAPAEHVPVVADALSEILARTERPDEAVAVLDGAVERLARENQNDHVPGLQLRKLAALAATGRWRQLADGAPELFDSPSLEVRVTARRLHADALAELGLVDDALAALAAREIESGSTASGSTASGSTESAIDPRESRPLLAKRIALLFDHNRADDASRLIEDVANGDSDEDLLFAARLYQGAERYADVVRLTQRFVEKEPESLQALFLLAAAHERGGDRQDAIVTFQRLLEISPDHAPSLNYLGYMWAEQGENLSEALALILRAISIDPDNGAYVDSLGWVYYRLGRYEEAREHMEWAARLIPGDATIFEHLGDVYVRLEERARARSSYQQALELSGDNLDQVRRKLEELDQQGL